MQVKVGEVKDKAILASNQDKVEVKVRCTDGVKYYFFDEVGGWMGWLVEVHGLGFPIAVCFFTKGFIHFLFQDRGSTHLISPGRWGNLRGTELRAKCVSTREV